MTKYAHTHTHTHTHTHSHTHSHTHTNTDGVKFYVIHTVHILTFSVTTRIYSIKYNKIEIIEHKSRQVWNSYMFRHRGYHSCESSNKPVWVSIAVNGTFLILLWLLLRNIRPSLFSTKFPNLSSLPSVLTLWWKQRPVSTLTYYYKLCKLSPKRKTGLKGAMTKRISNKINDNR
jgi:hypothetical protein